jgi:hypothetical protein
LFRLAVSTLTGWLGRDADVTLLSDIEQRFGSSLLDGLVSVWQPANQVSEK